MTKRKRGLPPLPKYVHSLLGPIEVQQVKMVDEKDSLGECNFENGVIRIKKTLERRQAHHTLAHERSHRILWDAGIHHMLDKLPKKYAELEEMICDAFATAHVNEMLSKLPNPQDTE